MNANDKLEILKSEMKIKPARLTVSLENLIREYAEKLEREEAILGLYEGFEKKFDFWGVIVCCSYSRAYKTMKEFGGILSKYIKKSFGVNLNAP